MSKRQLKISKRFLLTGGGVLLVILCVSLLSILLRIKADTFFGSNMGFESDLASWEYIYSPTSLSSAISVTSTGCHTGKCVEMTPATGTNWQFIKQPVGTLTPGKEYLLEAWFKTTSRSKVSIALVDSSWKNSSGVVAGGGKGFWTSASGTGDWVKGSSLLKIPLADDYGETTLNDTWYIYLSTDLALTYPDKFAYDDINLHSVDFKYIQQYGCTNSTTSKCLDFGSADESGGTFSLTNFDVSATDGAINYRAVKPSQVATISLPAFDVDAQGLPNNPMILEIKYKDTVDTSINSSSYEVPHRAIVASKIDYKSNDSLAYSGDKNNYPISYLGENGDNTWKFNQYPFQKSPFQLIRAINGYFSFIITMPSQVSSDSTLSIPIDYISLHSVTNDEIEAFNLKQREMLGYYSVSMPTNTTACSNCNGEATLFSKDIMEPIYENTMPLDAEINKTLSTTSALGEIEPLNLGVYSKNGVSDLTIEATDLQNKSGGSDLISKSNIAIFKVVYDETMLNPYGFTKSYAKIPDRLEPLSSFSIDANTSQQIWIKITTPATLSGKLYEGKVSLKKSGTVIRELPISYTVLPMKLEDAPAKNIIYHEPFNGVVGSDIEEVFKVYRDMGVDPFIYRGLGSPIKDGAGKITGFNTTTFETSLDRYIQEGVVKKNVEIETSNTWYTIYSTLYGVSPSTSALDIYAKLDSQTFKDAFGLAIQKFQAIAQARNLVFMYSVTDEPGDDPYRRIITDRLYPVIKANGGTTAVTYSSDCERTISSGSYTTPTGSIAPLVVDFKVWHPEHQITGFNESNPTHAFYTTFLSNNRNPIYNRFLHGFEAYKVNAKAVSAYAMDDQINDFYNDFDQAPTYKSPFTYPDFIMAYPTWSGQFLEAFNGEGIREGIKDSKYIATLEKLIADNPSSPKAVEASNYLSGIKNSLNPDFWNTYVKTASAVGYYPSIIQALDENHDSNDYAAFTQRRQGIINYIEQIAYPLNVDLIPSKSVYTNLNYSVTAVTNGVSYQWVQNSGPSTLALSNANTTQVSLEASVPGEYMLTFTASDGGNSLSKQIKIIVCKNGDINGSSLVDFDDFTLILNNWGVPTNGMADQNNDGIVDFLDFTILLGNWNN